MTDISWTFSPASTSGSQQFKMMSGTLHPIEIKKHADPNKNDIAAFDLLEKSANVKRGSGGVICLYDRLITLKGNDKIIPIQYI